MLVDIIFYSIFQHSIPYIYFLVFSMRVGPFHGRHCTPGVPILCGLGSPLYCLLCPYPSAVSRGTTCRTKAPTIMLHDFCLVFSSSYSLFALPPPVSPGSLQCGGEPVTVPCTAPCTARIYPDWKAGAQDQGLY